MSDPAPQQIGVVAESTTGETRVAATPATVRQLLALGYDVASTNNGEEALKLAVAKPFACL